MRSYPCDPPLTRFEPLPPEALADPLGPPATAVRVSCLHCRNEYSSDRIVWYAGMWCCPHIACGGVGYEVDIYPVGRRRRELREEDRSPLHDAAHAYYPVEHEEAQDPLAPGEP